MLLHLLSCLSLLQYFASCVMLLTSWTKIRYPATEMTPGVQPVSSALECLTGCSIEAEDTKYACYIKRNKFAILCGRIKGVGHLKTMSVSADCDDLYVIKYQQRSEDVYRHVPKTHKFEVKLIGSSSRRHSLVTNGKGTTSTTKPITTSRKVKKRHFQRVRNSLSTCNCLRINITSTFFAVYVPQLPVRTAMTKDLFLYLPLENRFITPPIKSAGEMTDMVLDASSCRVFRLHQRYPKLTTTCLDRDTTKTLSTRPLTEFAVAHKRQNIFGIQRSVKTLIKLDQYGGEPVVLVKARHLSSVMNTHLTADEFTHTLYWLHEKHLYMYDYVNMRRKTTIKFSRRVDNFVFDGHTRTLFTLVNRVYVKITSHSLDNAVKNKYELKKGSVVCSSMVLWEGHVFIGLTGKNVSMMNLEKRTTIKYPFTHKTDVKLYPG